MKLAPIGIIAALCAIALSSPARAQDAAPARQWTVKVANGECSLERAIAAPIPVRLLVQTVPGSDSYRLTIAGKDVPRRGPGS